MVSFLLTGSISTTPRYNNQLGCHCLTDKADHYHNSSCRHSSYEFFHTISLFTIKKPTTGYFSEIPELGPPIKRCWQRDAGSLSKSNGQLLYSSIL
jgi:hypothetical protein